MKLLAITFIVALLEFNPVAYGKEITYVKRKVELLQVFKEIKKQTGFNIIWNEREVNVNKLMNVNFHRSNIESVLYECAKKLKVSYSINRKIIGISRKK